MTDPVEVIPGRVVLVEGLFTPEESLRLRLALVEEATWSQERLSVQGVEGGVPFPRLVAWHGDEGVTYRYSRVDHPARPWTPAIIEIRERVRAVLPSVTFNGVLLNRYRDGLDSIGRHADVESDLVSGSPIAAVTLGTPRTIRFREMGRGRRPIVNIDPPDGSLLLMINDCQRTLTHEIRKQPEREGERISLTFRQVRR